MIYSISNYSLINLYKIIQFRLIFKWGFEMINEKACWNLIFACNKTRFQKLELSVGIICVNQYVR